ncbi:MAG: TolC family protein [Sphingobacteriaceae bacterium]|nr:TolC family protein [Sphingobacteriaceae bacterium]
MNQLIKKTLIIQALLLFSSVKISAQESGGSFNLQQSIDFALKNNAAYLNSDLDLKSAHHKRKEITGLAFPQISASADLKNYLDLPTSLLPGEFFGAPPGTFIPVRFGTKYNSTAGINASQILLSSDLFMGIRASKEFINLSNININRTKAEIISQVSKAYYTALINQQRIKLIDANIVKLKKIFDDTKALNQQGYVELIDVERLEVNYNNLNTERDKVAKLVELSIHLLKFQMGYKISDPILLSDSLNIDGAEENILSATKIDVSKRPEYQLLQTQQKMLELDVKRNKLGYLPSIAAYGAYQYNAQRQEFDLFDTNLPWFKIALIGGTINLNIFDGLQRHHKIQQAKIAALKNENNIKNLELATELEATAAAIAYSNAFASLQTQKKNMILAEHIYDSAQKKFTNGVGSNLEILNAETSMKEAQTNYLNAAYDLLISKTDYLKATGNLIK